MPSEIMVERVGNRLMGCWAMDTEEVEKLEHGVKYRAVINRPRNPKHHRLAFALFNLVFTHQDKYPTVEKLVRALKQATGLFEVEYTPEGTPFIVLDSISFSAMDQKAFSEWWDKALDVITTRIIPAANSRELEQQINELLNGT